MIIKITKKSVSTTKIGDDDGYTIILNVIGIESIESTEELFNWDISAEHNSANPVEIVKQKLKKQIEQKIEEYKKTQTIYNSGKIETLATEIESSLNK